MTRRSSSISGKRAGELPISGHIIKKAILPAFCFAALSTMAFEKEIYAAQTSNNVLAKKYVNISSGTLNLRASSSASTSIIASLSKGTAVTVYSESNGWAKVNANGKNGYVSTSLLSSTNPSNSSTATTAPVTKYVNVSSGSLNMRNGASISASVVIKLAKGTAVKVYSQTGGWAKIEVYGKTGYVSSAFLSTASSSTSNNSTPTTTQSVTKYVNVSSTSRLNLRKSASSGSAVLAKLTNGTAVKVTSDSGGWAKVQVNGLEGYVSSAFLSSLQSGTNSTTPAGQTSTTKYVNVSVGSSLDMYKSASANSSILLKLARGIAVKVETDSNGWAKITAYNQTGYVKDQFLSATKPAAGSNTATNGSSGQNSSNSVEKYVNIVYGSSLNMRSSASSSAAVITKLARGTIVTVHSDTNGWAQVTANGRTGYVSSQYLSVTAPFSPNTASSSIEKITQNYNISLNDLLKMEMAVNPQTDKKYNAYIRSDALTLTSATSGVVNNTGWNVRGGAGSNYWVIGQVHIQDSLKILGKVKGTDGYDWYQVSYNKQWVNASSDDVSYYLNPNNFSNSTVNSLQFLKLSVTANLNASEVNDRILKGKGILQGLASTFITAGNTYGVNEIYLLSHALLETNNGISQLANGVKVNGKTVYNMYGIGAYDNSAVASGSQFAYNAGWFTPEAAIIGGAKFIADGYINAGQDTLYKMRWNPASASAKGLAAHQYASDIAWAAKQVNQIYNLYSLLDSYKLVLETPKYK